MFVAELIGIALVAYGMWFAYRGLDMWFGTNREWWRPISHRKRYPYPAAGILLGVCFILLGLRFALNSVWAQARILGYAGGVLFVVVLLAGVIQPRWLHPDWYRRLHDRLGKERMSKLRAKAFELEGQEWQEISASEDLFQKWVDRAAPKEVSASSRGYDRPDAS
jgi:hypothetical protein